MLYNRICSSLFCKLACAVYKQTSIITIVGFQKQILIVVDVGSPVSSFVSTSRGYELTTMSLRLKKFILKKAELLIYGKTIDTSTTHIIKHKGNNNSLNDQAYLQISAKYTASQWIWMHQVVQYSLYHDISELFTLKLAIKKDCAYH